MANYFYRKNIVGADENSWGPRNDAWNRVTIGECNVKLYDDAGVLKVTKGRIGINDGTNEGISVIDTITTISIAGITNGNWAEIYMTVSGTGVTFTAIDTNTGVDIDWSTLPNSFTNAYDSTKGGYYISAARRCIGVIWKDSAGNLEGIINCLNNCEGFCGYNYYDSNEDQKLIWDVQKDKYSCKGEYEIGNWDMSTATGTASVNIAHHLGTNETKVKDMNFSIIPDTGSGDITTYNGIYPGSASVECVISLQIPANTNFVLQRRVGGSYDNANFNDGTINRGNISFEMSES